MNSKMTAPILMYHEICGVELPRHSYAVSVLQFEKQLEYINSNGYETILLEEYLQEIRGRRVGSKKKQVILTFDDAQASNYTRALPLLKRYGFKGIFFIPTSFIGRRPDLLDQRQIIEMSREGMSIQSHTHTHPFLNDLNLNQLRSEMETSKSILEGIIQKEVTLMSCPGGRFNRTVLEIAGEVGYKGLCISMPGVTVIDSNINLFGRSLICGSTTMKAFINIVTMNRAYAARKRLEYYLKDVTKRVIGNDLYHRFWKLKEGL